MWALVLQLPVQSRPRSILYPAAGVHLAPLVLCEALPEGTPCRLDLTEIDPGVEAPIDGLLQALARDGVISKLRHGSGADTHWQFLLSGHPVRLGLEIRVRQGDGLPPPLLDAEMLDGHDLVVSHDWAGDPVGNLRVILWYLTAARELHGNSVPRLMIEDLEAHPFPISLDLFGVEARVRKPYGHRVVPGTIATHGAVELGEPIFGGAVVLGFGDPWWRRVSVEDLTAVLDLLVFERFGWSRRNVLAPGPPLVVAPEALDWWSGFGARTVEGTLEPLSKRFVRRLAGAAVRAYAEMDTADQRALCRHLLHFRETLEAMAAGGTLPDPVAHAKVLDPDEMPPAMARQLETGLERSRQRAAETALFRGAAVQALPVFGETRVKAVLAHCEPAGRHEPESSRSQEPSGVRTH